MATGAIPAARIDGGSAVLDGGRRGQPPSPRVSADRRSTRKPLPSLAGCRRCRWHVGRPRDAAAPVPTAAAERSPRSDIPTSAGVLGARGARHPSGARRSRRCLVPRVAEGAAGTSPPHRPVSRDARAPHPGACRTLVDLARCAARRCAGRRFRDRHRGDVRPGRQRVPDRQPMVRPRRCGYGAPRRRGPHRRPRCDQVRAWRGLAAHRAALLGRAPGARDCEPPLSNQPRPGARCVSVRRVSRQCGRHEARRNPPPSAAHRDRPRRPPCRARRVPADARSPGAGLPGRDIERSVRTGRAAALSTCRLGLRAVEPRRRALGQLGQLGRAASGGRELRQHRARGALCTTTRPLRYPAPT